MTIQGFLKKQTKASIKEGRTRSAIRRIVFSAVEQALREHYGENYSNRCTQSAAAVSRLLRRCGIDNTVVRGEACFGQVIGSRLAWASFGGDPERFHCWTMTHFGELVDFTVSQHHLAPGMEPGGAPCPALWWNDASQMPGPFRYLPDPAEGRIAVSFADVEENAVFQRFKKSVDAAFETLLEEGEHGPSFEVVSSEEDLNRLSETGDPWAAVAWRFQDWPLPGWAQQRVRELCSNEPRP